MAAAAQMPAPAAARASVRLADAGGDDADEGGTVASPRVVVDVLTIMVGLLEDGAEARRLESDPGRTTLQHACSPLTAAAARFWQPVTPRVSGMTSTSLPAPAWLPTVALVTVATVWGVTFTAADRTGDAPPTPHLAL